jgi:pimeloyl-ACP methyl ester carboxylesterase
VAVLLVAVVASVTVACSSPGDDTADRAGSTSTTVVGGEARGRDRSDGDAARIPDDVALPIVFVHGFAGSAQQYETQAMRFTANGYPQERILAFEHDGAGLDIDGFVAGLDEFVDAALEQFDATQVYLVGHSRGTMVSSRFLTDPARVAKVAKYVALDGAPCVDVVPCVALTKATYPGQAHVEVATSAESFSDQFEFLVGRAPEVVDPPPVDGTVEISGRAVNFPANTGRADAHLDIWAVDPDTGQRTDPEPYASFDLGPDGGFGPVGLQSGAHYEYVLSAPDTEVQHHLYLQPYVRDSRLVRLLSSEPDGPTRANTNTSAEHSALIVMRMREWYALDRDDIDGDQRDALTVGVVGKTDPVDVLPDFVGNATIGLHLHDDAATPGVTTRTALPYFADQPFQSGIDVFLPASADGSGTIRVVNVPRGDAERTQTLNVGNWPSSGHSVSVVFTDRPAD